jgi:tetratricopeptide (TPR) repeat protein
MQKLRKIKYLFIIGTAIILFTSLWAVGDINQAVEKVQSVETKSLSADGIITAFTFLLAALTIMATLFGIFIGYIWYKSSKEYEQEVVKAEQAANRAEAAAKVVDTVLNDIRSRGESTVRDIRSKGEKAINELELYKHGKPQEIVDSKGRLEDVFDKHKIKDERFGDKGPKYKTRSYFVSEIRSRLEKNNIDGALDTIEKMSELYADDARIWYLWAYLLMSSKRYAEAVEKSTLAIDKDPEFGKAYLARVHARLFYYKSRGPKPSTDDIVKDIQMAKKYGVDFTDLDKRLLTNFLNDDDYKELLGCSKEEVKVLQERLNFIGEKTKEVADRIIDKLEEKNYEEAAGLLEASTILVKDHPVFWFVWAIILTELKRYKEALEKTSTAIQKDPTFGPAYFGMAEIKLEWGKNGGPVPYKTEILADVNKALECGYHLDKDDKRLLAEFLTKSEYNELIVNQKRDQIIVKKE